MFVSLNDLLGMGQVAARKEAESDTKRSLSKQAISVNDRSKALAVSSLPSLEAEARAVLALLDTYQAWDGSSWPLVGYDSSQTARANLQAAISNIRVRTGVKEGAIHGQQQDVNVLVETAKNTPTAVGDRAKELQDQAFSVVECFKDPIACLWDKTTKSQKLALGIGAGALTLGAVVYTTTIFGGVISAAGNVAEKMTRNAPKRRRRRAR